MGTFALAIAAFYQIYHTEHKAEKLKPKLIILPELQGIPCPKMIFFHVYNIGRSMAKNCSIRLTIIRKRPSMELRTLSWAWSEYIGVVNSAGVSTIKNKDSVKSKDIFPKEGASTTYLSIWDLLGIDEKSSENVTQTTFVIRIKVYSENMEIPATYPIELEWTGKCFNNHSEYYQNDNERVQELEYKLNKAASDEMMNLRESIFFKKRRI